VLGIENVSYLTQAQSDALCRIASGAGFSIRKLYTNDEVVVFGGARPLVLNGIPDFAETPDLLDRSLLVTFPTMEDGNRSELRVLREQFAEDHPLIFGALCDLLASGLRHEAPSENGGRMADAYSWMYRCSHDAPWGLDSFVAAYKGKREDAIAVGIESCPIMHILDNFVRTRTGKEFNGTIQNLHDQLTASVREAGDYHVLNSKAFPQTAKKLGSDLRRYEVPLAKAGIKQERGKKGKHGRPIHLWTEQPKPKATVAPTPDPEAEFEAWFDMLTPDQRAGVEELM
jgi:hypothetical protein